VEDGTAHFPAPPLSKVGREAYKTATSRAVCRESPSVRGASSKDPATISEIDWVRSFRRESRAASARSSSRRSTHDGSLDEQPGSAAVRGASGQAPSRARGRPRARRRPHLRGPVNPHDILRIKGARAVQEYLLQRGAGGLPPAGREDQRQAHRRDRTPDAAEGAVMDPGETEFLEGEQWTSQVFRDENERVKKRRSRRRRRSPCCSASRRRALTTQSFISAASFQETTRVLTDASIRGGQGRPAGPQGEHHHRPPDSGRYWYVPVSGSGRRARGSGRFRAAATAHRVVAESVLMADEEDFPALPRPGVRASEE
jgi:DNA-directed RNA polymerase subunit beta'